MLSRFHMDLGLRTALVASALFLLPATGYPSGNVAVVCDTMKPRHGSEPSPDSSPYTISADRSTFKPGDQITVTLSAPPSATPFKGFLIEARDASKLDGPALGSFGLINSTGTQLLSCNGRQGSAVSHTSAALKSEVQAIWNPPRDSPASVRFLATVVQHFRVYWLQVPSAVLVQDGFTPPPTQPSTTVTEGTTTTAALLPGTFSAEGCGSKKSCLRDPPECDPRRDPQCFFLSFTTEGPSVMFQLSGPSHGYVSFALSWDQWMGNDDVYLCVKNKNGVDVEAAHTAGRMYPELASQDVLAGKAWRMADGGIQCSFRRDVVIERDQERFNLNRSYYLFVAHGQADDGIIRKHQRQPLISSRAVPLTGPPQNLGGSRSPLLIKFHGAFMLAAWMMTVSTGIVIARYFKLNWPGRTLCGEKVWFQVHRSLMIITVVLTSISFVLPFVYRGGWSRSAGLHPYFGTIVTSLAILQPLMAIFRPAPDAPRRYIFNWLHFSVGTVAHILAVVAIILGFQQQALLLPPHQSTYLLACWAAWGAVVVLVLELHHRGLYRMGKSVTLDETRILSLTSDASRQDVLFKRSVLALFVLGNLAFVIALWSFISSV